MKLTWKMWLIIIAASLFTGAAVGGGIGLVQLHPSTISTSTSQHK